MIIARAQTSRLAAALSSTPGAAPGRKRKNTSSPPPIAARKRGKARYGEDEDAEEASALQDTDSSGNYVCDGDTIKIDSGLLPLNQKSKGKGTDAAVVHASSAQHGKRSLPEDNDWKVPFSKAEVSEEDFDLPKRVPRRTQVAIGASEKHKASAVVPDEEFNLRMRVLEKRVKCLRPWTKKWS